MSDSPWFDAPLPHGLTQDVLEDWARKYAPRLMFHRNERHFPSTPESFHRNSRFRESRQGSRDQGWRKEAGWETSNRKGRRYYQIEWDVIEGETAKRSGDFVELHPSLRPTLRPHGGRNLFRSRGRGKKGLFLERDRISNRSSSGTPPLDRRVTAPVFLDAAPVLTSAGPVVKVLYWFFYELNRWHGFLTHEGDWEHVTYLVTVDSIEQQAPPSHVYFAQHNTGDLRAWSKLESADSEHPTMFVDPNGHPTMPGVGKPSDYESQWETWTQEFRWIRDSDWREYSGAWGEVGETKHTTGPLGPWFKQDLDVVRVKRDDSGKLIICVPKG